jgi:Lrp/AsnC family leucine-responsive transcriptional regulator
MDDTDRTILTLLAADSRRSLADIGAQVDLAPSSVNDRIRRLTATGALRRFTVEADPAALCLPTLAFVSVALREDADEATFRDFAATHPLVLECHHVTGAWSYLLKVRTPDTAALEGFLADLKATRLLARTDTVIALSSPVPGPFIPKDAP